MKVEARELIVKLVVRCDALLNEQKGCPKYMCATLSTSYVVYSRVTSGMPVMGIE